MAKWKDIIESPDFQRKSTDEQNRLLETYYNDKIANSSEWTPEEKKKIYNRMQFRLGGIQERLAENDPSFQKYAEGEERRDRYERQVKRYVKEPTEEERRMKGEAIRTFDPMNLVQTFGRDDTEARLSAAIEAEKPHKGLAGLTESMLSGVENSTVARLLASHVFKPEDYREYDRMRAYNPEGPVNRVAASAMSLLADSPIYEAGSMIGGPAGAFGLHSGLTELYRAKMNNEIPNKIGIDSLKVLGNVAKETGIGLAEGKIMELTMLGSGKIADEIGAFRAFKQYKGAGMLPKDMAYKSFRQGIGSIETSKFAKNALEVPATVAGLTAGSAIMRDQPITPEGIAETTMLIGLLKAIHGPAKMRKDITPESASRISEQLSEKLGVSKREATEIIKSPEKTGRAINSIYDLQLQLMREELAKSQSAPEAPKITEAKSEGRDSVKEFESRIPEPPDELLKPAPDLERRQIGEKLLNAPEQAEKWGNRTAERREGIRNVIDNVWEGIEKNATPEQFNNLLSDHTLISDYIDPHATGYAKLPLTDKGIVRNEISRRLDDYINPKVQGEEPKYRRIFEKLRENEPQDIPQAGRLPGEKEAYVKGIIERDTAENEFVRKKREEAENAKNAEESMARTNSLVMSLGGPEKAKQIDPDNLKPVLNLMNMGPREFNNIISTVPAAGPVKYDPQNPGANAKAKIGGLLPSFKNASRQIERLFGKTMHDNFVFPITQGGHNYAVEQKSSKADFKSFVKLVENDSGKSFSLKERERIGAYLVGRQENGAEILASMKREYITKEMLTPREVAIVDYFDRELPKLLERLNHAREIAGLKPIEGVSNYFTFLRKFSWAEEMGINPVFAQNEKWKDANIIDASPKGYSFQFGETRYESSRPLDLDAFYVFERYNNAALKSIHMTPVVGRLRTMLDDHGLLDRNAIAHQYLTETLDYVGGKRGHHDPIMERIANKLSKNLGIYYLSANLNSIFIQPSAYALTFTSMGKYSIMGARDFLNPKMRKFAYDKSTELQSRVFDVAAEEITKSFTGKLGKIKAKAAEIGMTPMKYVDLGCAEATWLTGYNYATKHEGLSGKEAYLYADKLVARTQGSGARVHLAPVQRTPLGKAFTVFNTFMINSWNFMLDDVVGQSNLSHYSRGRQLGRFVAAAAIMNTMSEVMGYYVPWGITNTPFPAPLSAAWERINGQSWMESLNGDDPDRKGESLGMGALEAGKETMSMVPIVGGSFRRGGKSAGGAAAQTLVELFDMFSEQRGAVTKIKVAQMAGKLSGIPGMGQAMKGVKGYYNWTVKQERAAKKELTPGQEYRKMKAEANKDYNAMMSEYRKMQRGF